MGTLLSRISTLFRCTSAICVCVFAPYDSTWCSFFLVHGSCSCHDMRDGGAHFVCLVAPNAQVDQRWKHVYYTFYIYIGVYMDSATKWMWQASSIRCKCCCGDSLEGKMYSFARSVVVRVESGRVGKLYMNNIVVCSGMVVGCYVAYGTNGCATKCEKRKLHDMHTYFYFYSGCIWMEWLCVVRAKPHLPVQPREVKNQKIK